MRFNSKSRLADSSALFQPLETRLLLAATHAIWRVLGTPKDDVINISLSNTNANQLLATLNGKVVAKRLVSSVPSIFVSGGAGNDQITINLGANNPIPALIDGGAGKDSLTGGAGKDSIFGGTGNDTLIGGLGDDSLVGGTGKNTLIGNEDNDTLKGGGKSDQLVGGLGDDLLVGGKGDDQLSGGYDDDSLRGNEGNDELIGGEGANTLVGGAGKDTLHRAQSSSKKSRYLSDKSDIWQNDFSSNPLSSVDDIDALKQKLIDQAVAQYKNTFGQSAWIWWDRPYIYNNDGYGADLTVNYSISNSAPTANPVSTDHSTTNTQVSGVDEADIVKTDGDFIYLINNNQLVILDAYPADQTSIVSTTSLDGCGANLYLDGDRLTVVTTKYIYDENSGWNPYYGWNIDVVPTVSQMGDIAVGASVSNCLCWRPSKTQTVVTVYDVANPAAPQLVSATALDGSLSSSRDIDGNIYLVLNQNIQLPTPLILKIEPSSDETPENTTDEDRIMSINLMYSSTYIYESEEAYRARLEAMDITELLPGYTVTQGDDTTTGSLIQTSKLYAQQNPGNQSGIFSVVTIDAEASTPGPIDECSILGCSGQIYMAADALYVASTTYTDPLGNWRGDPSTSLYKFDVNDQGVDLGGAGQVPGWILNSYSMDQYDGYFRIATTTTGVVSTTVVDDPNAVATGPTSSNNLFVLDDTGDTLDVVGALTGIALTERIYSARFDGDRAFLVTYRQFDPLFSIDLSDPANPTIAGQLELPGYSSYLMPIGDDLLLGIGQDVAFNEPAGLKASLFNVSDPAHPTLIDTYYFTSNYTNEQNSWWYSWTRSPGEWDPHAISYFPDQKILALPVLDWGWWHDHAKLQLLQIDPVAGFTDLGAIHQTGQVSRSLRIGNYIYSISSTEVKVVSIDDPTQTVADVLLNEDTDQPVYIL